MITVGLGAADTASGNIESSGLRIPDIPFGGRGPPSTILVGSSLHNDPIMDLPYKVDKHNIE